MRLETTTLAELGIEDVETTPGEAIFLAKEKKGEEWLEFRATLSEDKSLLHLERYGDLADNYTFRAELQESEIVDLVSRTEGDLETTMEALKLVVEQLNTQG